MVQSLLDAGATIHGDTLYAAVFSGHETVVKLLLAAGADVNATGRDWKTPLEGAAEKASVEIVRLLLAAGAEVTESVIEGASFRGYERVVQLLLAAKTNVDA